MSPPRGFNPWDNPKLTIISAILAAVILRNHCNGREMKFYTSNISL